ncbi:unnamed protein product, partial [Mesorhabditis belari]|uniref:Uncharacterized protein n=1 Tax=Mesorhabditis belari TaxID=2138241 RepID=A0AAF3F8F7_9BILA
MALADILLLVQRHSVADARSITVGQFACVTVDHLDPFRNRTEIGIRQRQERKVTQTVVAIITCHIFTHFPSCLPFVWDLAESIWQFLSLAPVVPNQKIRYISSNIINSVLLWGKTQLPTMIEESTC